VRKDRGADGHVAAGTSDAALGVAAAGRLAQAERYQRGEISQRPGY